MKSYDKAPQTGEIKENEKHENGLSIETLDSIDWAKYTQFDDDYLINNKGVSDKALELFRIYNSNGLDFGEKDIEDNENIKLVVQIMIDNDTSSLLYKMRGDNESTTKDNSHEEEMKIAMDRHEELYADIKDLIPKNQQSQTQSKA